MLSLFRLLRFKMIAYVAFILIAMRYFCLKPALAAIGYGLQLPTWAFVVYVLAVCLLLGGAYVINDYFDKQSDIMSHVRPVYIGKCITHRGAISIHAVFTSIAVVLVLLTAFYLKVWKIGVAFFLLSSFLWVYSAIYRKVLFGGSVVVAILAALLPYSLFLFEMPLLSRAMEQTGNVYYGIRSSLYISVLPYSLLLLINVFMYEVTKDLFTEVGDKACKIRTLVVRYGRGPMMTLLKLLTVFMVSANFGAMLLADDWISLRKFFVLFAVILPYLFYLWILINRPTDRKGLIYSLRMVLVFMIFVSVFNVLEY